jgi:hypothetical protein
MAVAWRIGVCTFRTLNDPLSGELRVKGSARRRGARGVQSLAKNKSLASCAGSDDGDGPTDGESAHTSAAHAAGSEPCADSAETNGCVTTRAPKEEKPDGEDNSRQEKESRDLPRDGFEFVREVNQEKQLVNVAKGLLDKSDEKVVQKVLQQLLSIAYSRNTKAKTEKVRTYIHDLPMANRD